MNKSLTDGFIIRSIHDAWRFIMRIPSILFGKINSRDFFRTFILSWIPFQEHNLGVICAAAHACSLLTNHGAFEWHAAGAEIIQQGRLAGEYCKKHGIELGKLAIWYAAQLKGPATFLVGMSTKGTAIFGLFSLLFSRKCSNLPFWSFYKIICVEPNMQKLSTLISIHSITVWRRKSMKSWNIAWKRKLKKK